MKKSKIPGRGLAAALSTAALVAGALVAAPAAHSATSARLVADMACPVGSQTVSFSPGVTLTPQSVTVTYNVALGVCASLTQPQITSGSSQGTVTVTLDCLDLLSTTTGTQTFHWSDGQSSVLSFTRTVTSANGQTVITLTGPITSGLFTGRIATFTVVEPALDLTACLTSRGLTGQTGVTTLLIT
ncbi:hypothetical protein [Streptomyces sp. NPDC005012]|uniref:hypothetical protein n=1 Tax=Streptomyces sp. NPDC005012 TaxID=3154558 RepID=UPI0033BE837C